MSSPSAAAIGYVCRSNFKSNEQIKVLLAHDIKNQAFALPRRLIAKTAIAVPIGNSDPDTPLACPAIHVAQRSPADRRCPVHCQKCSKQPVTNRLAGLKQSTSLLLPELFQGASKDYGADLWQRESRRGKWRSEQYQKIVIDDAPLQRFDRYSTSPLDKTSRAPTLRP
jgi:hypothetical protein